MIRVFVGCAPNGEDAESQAVLEYTLRKHASQPVDITWMALSRNPSSPFFSKGKDGWQIATWSTPFSGFRFVVPLLCGFEGRAIYTDSDVIYMADIAELWGQDFSKGKCVKAKAADDPNRLCVSLWDCAAAKPFMPMRRDGDAITFVKSRLRSACAIEAFDGNWNCIDGENFADIYEPDIKAVHYSMESRQPHLRYAIPRLAKAGLRHWFDGPVSPHWRGDIVELFDRSYADAIAAGYTLERYIPAQLFGGYRIASHKNYGGHQWAR